MTFLHFSSYIFRPHPLLHIRHHDHLLDFLVPNYSKSDLGHFRTPTFDLVLCIVHFIVHRPLTLLLVMTFTITVWQF